MKTRTADFDTVRAERGTRAGFTLIELLTVIAILAILAAVIFPVISNVRVRAQQTQVRSNLLAIHPALALFKQDKHYFPTALGELRTTGPNGIFMPADVLFPEWLKDRSAFLSPNKDVADPNDFIKVDIPGSAARGYVPLTLPPDVVDEVRDGKLPAYDNMDGTVEGNNFLLHYSRYRTFNTNDCDYKRQLGFRNPPETTVVTWNDSFADWAASKGDYFVLFLNGQVKKFSARQVKQKLQEKIDRGCPDMDVNLDQIWRLEP